MPRVITKRWQVAVRMTVFNSPLAIKKSRPIESIPGQLLRPIKTADHCPV